MGQELLLFEASRRSSARERHAYRCDVCTCAPGIASQTLTVFPFFALLLCLLVEI